MFVERELSGVVKGVYRQRQPGYAEEELPDTHPDVLAFLAPPPPPPKTNAERIDAEVARNVAFDALLIVLAADKGKTKAQLVADLKAAKP